MMKLTENQIIACNIIDVIINDMAQNKGDIALKLKAYEEFTRYKESNNRDDLKIMKKYIKSLYTLFKDAYDDWR